MQRALRITAVATLAATYALVVLGSTVRVTRSGMGCVSWPLCNGHAGFAGTFHALIEQAHRYLAAIVSAAAVSLVVLAWRARAAPRAVAAAWAAVALVGLQVLLGAVTVLTHNSPPTVALHLIGGLALLGAVTLTVTASFSAGHAPAMTGGVSGPGALAWWALGSTFTLLVSGTIVVDGGASRACRSWPWCSAHAGTPWTLVAAQLAHRGLAGIAVVLLAALSIRTLAARRRSAPAMAPLAWGLMALLVAQVAAGAASAVLGAPPAAQDVHLALAAAIWACAVALVSLHAFTGSGARSGLLAPGGVAAAAATLGRGEPDPGGAARSVGQHA